MLDRLRKAFRRGDAQAPAATSKPSPVPAAVASWAAGAGLASAPGQVPGGFGLGGEVQGRLWRLECTAPSRDFIQGLELRARVELDLPPDLSAIVMNRALKDRLEQQAYAHYTGPVQTSVGDALTEEARWLAMFDEVRWSAAAPAFWEGYAVLTDRRENAQRWLDASVLESLLTWPLPSGGTAASARPVAAPFMLILLRGKVYLRMEYTPATVDTLRHAVALLGAASTSGLVLAGKAPGKVDLAL